MRHEDQLDEFGKMQPDCRNEMILMNASQLINQLPDATFAIDINGKIIAWNDALEELTGCKAKDMIGKGNYEHALPFWKVRRPMSIDLVLSPNNKYENTYTDLNREGTRLIVKAEVPGILFHGKPAYLWKKASPFYDHNGILVGAIISIRDITSIYEQDRSYRTLLDSLQIGVYVVQNGKIIFTNHHIPRYSGYLMEELCCTEILNFVHPEDRQTVRENAIAMLKGERTIPYEFRIIDKGGNIKWLMESVSPIIYNGKCAVIGNTMEITEIKEAREKLERLEKLEASILASVPHALFGVENREIFFANKSMETVFGWTVDELIGQNTRIIFRSDQEHKDYGELLYSALEKQACYIFEWEHPFVRKDGKEIICRMSVARIGETLSESRRIVATFEDITEMKKAKEAQDKLEQMKKLEASILASVPHALFGVENREIFFANKSMETVFGWTVDELIGQNTRIIFRSDQEHKDYGELLYSALEKQECYIFEWEHPFVRKDGKEIICHMSVARIGETLSENRRIVATFEDITEIKKVEEALRELRQRLADIIEFLPDATLAIDLEDKLIVWNRAAEEMTGVSAKEVLGKDNYEYALPFWKERRPLAVNMVLKPNKDFEKTYPVFNREENLLIVEASLPGVRIKGENAYLWCKASPLYDSKGNIAGAIEVFRDITERKLAEESLKKREKELEIKSHELEELNTALKVLLKRREEDKNELEESLLANVRELVLPYIEEIKMKRLDKRDLSYLKILESNLRNIISPFSHKLTHKYTNLTNREVRVADLIKEGKSSQEIADFLNITESAVNIYRYRMRKKLNLKKKDNLREYLLSLT